MVNKKVIRIILSLLILTGTLVTLYYRSELDSETLDTWFKTHPLSSPLVFIIFSVVMTLFFFPTTLLSILGGALYGPIWGTIYNIIYALTGAILNFIIARYVATEWLEKNLSGKSRKLKEGIDREGWQLVLLVRMIPSFPFSILNYLLGLTRISLGTFSIITFICTLPRVIAYAYVGDLGRKTLTGVELDSQFGLAFWILLGVILLPYVIIKIRGRIRKYL